MAEESEGRSFCFLCRLSESCESVELVREKFRVTVTLERTLEKLWDSLFVPTYGMKEVFASLGKDNGNLFCSNCLPVLTGGLRLQAGILRLEEQMTSLGKMLGETIMKVERSKQILSDEDDGENNDDNVMWKNFRSRVIQNYDTGILPVKHSICRKAPKSAEIAEAPKLAVIAEDSNPAGIAEAPKSAENAEDPKSAEIAEDPKLDVIAEDPNVAVIAENPNPAVITEAPNLAVIAEDPSPAVITEAPNLAVIAEDPSPAAITEAPKPGVIAENPNPAIIAEDPKPAGIADTTKNQEQLTVQEKEETRKKRKRKRSLRQIQNQDSYSLHSDNGVLPLKHSNCRMAPKPADIAEAPKRDVIFEDLNPPIIAVASKSAIIAETPPNSAGIAEDTNPAEITNNPNPAVITDAPNPAAIAEAPESAGIVETLKPAGVAETPKTAVIAETPKPAGIAETPKPAEIAEAPKPGGIPEDTNPAGIAETPKPSEITDNPNPAVITDAPNPAAIAEAPKSAGIAGTVKPAGIAETPKPAGIAETPKPAGIAETPKPAGIAETLKSAEIPEDPNPAIIAEDPNRAVVAEAPKPAEIAEDPNPAGISKPNGISGACGNSKQVRVQENEKRGKTRKPRRSLQQIQNQNPYSLRSRKCVVMPSNTVVNLPAERPLSEKLKKLKQTLNLPEARVLLKRLNCPTYGPEVAGVARCPSCSFVIDLRSGDILSSVSAETLRMRSYHKLFVHFRQIHFHSIEKNFKRTEKEKAITICCFRCSHNASCALRIALHYFFVHVMENRIQFPKQVSCPESSCPFVLNIIMSPTNVNINQIEKFLVESLTKHVITEHDQRGEAEVTRNIPWKSLYVETQDRGNGYKCTRCDFIVACPLAVTSKVEISDVRHRFYSHFRQHLGPMCGIL